MFETKLMVGWADIDFNAHMRNTAYLDKAADVRMLFFAAHGFPAAEFVRLKLGPVVMRDEIDYYREVNLLDELRITLSLAGLAADGSRFLIRNEFYGPDGSLAARVTSLGGWLDQAARRLVPAPPGLLAALGNLARTEDFQTLPSSVR